MTVISAFEVALYAVLIGAGFRFGVEVMRLAWVFATSRKDQHHD